MGERRRGQCLVCRGAIPPDAERCAACLRKCGGRTVPTLEDRVAALEEKIARIEGILSRKDLL